MSLNCTETIPVAPTPVRSARASQNVRDAVTAYLQGTHIEQMCDPGLAVPLILQRRGEDVEQLMGILPEGKAVFREGRAGQGNIGTTPGSVRTPGQPPSGRCGQGSLPAFPGPSPWEGRARPAIFEVETLARQPRGERERREGSGRGASHQLL